MPFYKVNTVKLTYGEFWRISGGCMPFAIAATFKTLGVGLKVPTRLAYLEQVNHLTLEELPQLSRGTQMQHRKECESLGLQFQFFYMIPPMKQACAAVYLDAERKLIAQVLVVRPEESPGSQEKVVFACSSIHRSAIILNTGNSAQQFNIPKGIQPVYLPGKSLLDTLKVHEARIAKASADIITFTPDQIDECIKGLNNIPLEFNINRGVYVPE